MSALKVVDRVPDLSGSTQTGELLRLGDFVGKKGLVVFFYPKDGTPICTREACAFRDSYEQFTAAGFEVVGVSGDTEASHAEFAREHRLNFPLLSDAHGAIRAAFGVPKTLGLFPGRVTYVVDQAGIIRLVFSAQLASDEHVQQALRAIAGS